MNREHIPGDHLLRLPDRLVQPLQELFFSFRTEWTGRFPVQPKLVLSAGISIKLMHAVIDTKTTREVIESIGDTLALIITGLDYFAPVLIADPRYNGPIAQENPRLYPLMFAQQVRLARIITAKVEGHERRSINFVMFSIPGEGFRIEIPETDGKARDP